MVEFDDFYSPKNTALTANYVSYLFATHIAHPLTPKQLSLFHSYAHLIQFCQAIVQTTKAVPQ
jgi:hypothetical protein